MRTHFMLPVIALLMVLSGCSMFRSADDDSRAEVSVYSGSTETYNVEVRITEIEGRCSERRIRLNRVAKLHTTPTVHHVDAIDHRCNGQIDRMRFRVPEDSRRMNRGRLLEDIWHSFYRVVPIEKHMG